MLKEMRLGLGASRRPLGPAHFVVRLPPRRVPAPRAHPGRHTVPVLLATHYQRPADGGTNGLASSLGAKQPKQGN
jgi:hypothetical protein